MKDPLALENRRRIFEHIERFPGTHIREMERELQLSIGVLTYHLDQLEGHGLIRSEGENKRSYFKAEDYTKADRKMISVLRSKRSEQIAALLISNEFMSFKDMRERLDISNSTLSYHMGRLVKSGVVDTTKFDRETIFHLRDKEAVIAALMSIGKTYDPVGSFIDIWESLSKKP